LIPDYTIVCGVDSKHLDQLSLVWPTWKKHKPSLLQHPMIIFRDKEQISHEDVCDRIDHPKLNVFAWPIGNTTYEGNYDDRFFHPQCHKMLTGFVYVASMYVSTLYWLKLDTDVIANGKDDWIDPTWFDTQPAIVSQPWTFTKPPDQMLLLDKWVEDNAKILSSFAECSPLNLVPEEGSDRVCHKRIISWCAFFNTGFTQYCALAAEKICGSFKLPVPSQDGFLWYCATRLGLEIKTSQMKKRGWEHWLTRENIVKSVERAMSNGTQ